MNLPPPSPSEKLALTIFMTIFIWHFAALVSIPLYEAASLLPYCLWTPPGLAHIHTCLPVLTILNTFENWMVAEPSIATIAAHRWPVPLTATAFTILFLRWWWRRG